jgi:hypothetical protein
MVSCEASDEGALATGSADCPALAVRDVAGSRRKLNINGSIVAQNKAKVSCKGSDEDALATKSADFPGPMVRDLDVVDCAKLAICRVFARGLD